MDSQQLISALHEAQRALGGRACRVRIEQLTSGFPKGLVRVRHDAAPHNSAPSYGEFKTPEIILTVHT